MPIAATIAGPLNKPGEFVAKNSVERLRQNISSVFLGHTRAVDLLLIGLLGRGHVLI